MSGARAFFDFPAKSLSKSISIFSIEEIFFIILIFGADLLFFSISFKYEAAIPIFFASSLCPISFEILISRIKLPKFLLDLFVFISSN